MTVGWLLRWRSALAGLTKLEASEQISAHFKYPPEQTLPRIQYSIHLPSNVTAYALVSRLCFEPDSGSALQLALVALVWVKWIYSVVIMIMLYHQLAASHMGIWSTRTWWWWWRRDSCSWGATSSAGRGPWLRESRDPWWGLRGSCGVGYGLPVNSKGWSCPDSDLPSCVAGGRGDIFVSRTIISNHAYGRPRAGLAVISNL